ncbi:bifunctional acetate--CoA ligase family protein/GNAT family N-acetyltransferase [Desulfohalovibrio reitneri]|uniref:bifunctional acetate--CoA ligase family protein/GNAT family N-acetyltransferase n=1 Tax=Desulfohalovibrio reitneri TaxID=1307759 RepID=UPI0004A73D3E|nr:bifunctional acetate--CoA ligase family protein/GNAT family N-acetyltransferase [Desulfohalovibrio reitneri]
MSLSNLDALFKPSSVAVVGASNQPGSAGFLVMRNLLHGEFPGPVMPVADKAKAISGVLTYPSVEALPQAPDLGMVCSDAAEAPDTIRALGKKGARAVILSGPGYAGQTPKEAEALRGEIRVAAKEAGVRVLGPGGLGLITANLNASLAATGILPGRIAFITQSDSLFTTVLEWASDNAIGFSHFISLGEQLDVDFADVLDYLGGDPMTRSILLYVESLTDARRFMSAARASARNKPILVMKPDEVVETTLPEDICVFALDDEQDAVYDVAFRRAGIVRVRDVDSLFDGARTLVRSQPLLGDNLAILTNGRSAGLLAADACLKGGANLACLSGNTAMELEKRIGRPRAGENPVVMPFNADGAMYTDVLKLVLKDPDVHAVLVAQVPFAEVEGEESARGVADIAVKTKRTVLTCWMGGERAREARAVFAERGVATFVTTDQAIHAFQHMVDYRRNQEMLTETPDSLPTDFFPDTTRVRELVEAALADGRTRLSDQEAKEVMTSYGVPIVETRVVVSAREAVHAAEELGYPVAVKVRSPEITQPFEVGGISLDLETPEQVWDACAHVAHRLHRHAPQAHIDGYIVQQMGRRPGAHELYVGALIDPTFGPVIRFGHGGMASRIIGDFAVALPPLNMALAQELIDRTRISRLLHQPGANREVDLDDICLTLIQVSQLITDVPQVTSLEMNPVFADEEGVLALSAKITVSRTERSGPDRLAIRPYPSELEECVKLKDGQQVTIRPIRPEDAPAHLEFVRKLDPDDLRLRFFGTVHEFEFADMPRFTQIDYDREMAFIATTERRGEPVTLGVVRTSTSPDNEKAEFAIIVASEMKGQGLGSLLFDKMIRYTASRGTKWLTGETMPENKAMAKLAEKFGFEVNINYEDDLVTMRLDMDKVRAGG